jgi:hypothetical protein
MERRKDELQMGITEAGPEGSRSNLIVDRLFSIGHSNLEFSRFLQLLQGAGVSTLIDVRSHPFSRWVPWCNRPNLELALVESRMRYIFRGDSLGGRPSQADVYDSNGRLDFDRVKSSDFFQEGIEDLLHIVKDSKTAMTCSEEDPIDCHRGLLVAPALKERGIAATHIRSNGSLESQIEFESRLIKITGAGAGLLDGLLAATLSSEDRRQILADAYRIQWRRKAFRLSAEQVE